MVVKVIDNFLSEEELDLVKKEWPKENDSAWYRRTDLFQKNQYGCNDFSKIGKGLTKIIEKLNSDQFIQFINDYLKIDGLKKDPYVHGGGIVQYGTGGYLDYHLDYDINPKHGLQRRANVLLYLNEDWEEDWGGALKLYDGHNMVEEVFPKYNRLVIFSVDDKSVHGFPEPLKCPPGQFRKSINVYYLTEPITDICKRPRAFFLPGPLDENGEPINVKKWTKSDFEKRDNYLKNIQIKQYESKR